MSFKTDKVKPSNPANTKMVATIKPRMMYPYLRSEAHCALASKQSQKLLLLFPTLGKPE
jgi:hypothetical protein